MVRHNLKQPPERISWKSRLHNLCSPYGDDGAPASEDHADLSIGACTFHFDCSARVYPFDKACHKAEQHDLKMNYADARMTQKRT